MCSTMQLIPKMTQFTERLQQLVIEGIHLGIGSRSARSIHEHLHPPQWLNQAFIRGELQVLQDLLDGAANGEEKIAIHLPAHHRALPDYGRYVSCNLGTLIESIHVSPHSPVWYKDVVASVTRSYGPSGTLVTQSELDASLDSLF
jgi:hypothetical protein